jgi:hypothetical protein
MKDVCLSISSPVRVSVPAVFCLDIDASGTITCLHGHSWLFQVSIARAPAAIGTEMPRNVYMYSTQENRGRRPVVML